MSETQSSDGMRSLVWFMTGLAFLGIIMALALYFMGVIPVQVPAIHPPVNGQCLSCL